MWKLIDQFHWQDGVDIGIVTFLVYRPRQILRGSRFFVRIAKTGELSSR